MKKCNIIIELWNWCKKEAVLTIAIILAIISAFFVHPDKEYIGYIDFRTLAILFCLMAVMAGLQQIGLFQYVAEKLLKRVRHIRGIVFILVMLCFFSSMFITNDVALITFVPFTIMTLKLCGKEKYIIYIAGAMIPDYRQTEIFKYDLFGQQCNNPHGSGCCPGCG